MSKSLKYYRYILITALLLHSVFNAQNSNVSAITNLIEQDSLQKAELIAMQNIKKLKIAENYKELTQYIFPTGKINELNQDFEKAKSDSKKLLDFINQNSKNPNTLYLANIEFSKLCLDIGELPTAYKYGKKAKTQALKSKVLANILDSEYYLADYGMKLGQIDLLEKHVRRADSIIKKNTTSKFKITARVYNLFGALMFFTSKQDSAIHYFEKALKHIPNLEQNVENAMYLPAAIKGNMSLIKLNQGKPSEAKPLLESSINLAKKFLDSTKNHPLENRVKRNLTIGFSSLNGLHFDLGEFDKSDIISKLAYNYTKENFPTNSQEFFMAAITHAEVKNEQREFKKALEYLDISSKSLKTITGDNFQLKAFLYNDYSDVYSKIGDTEKELKFRELSYLNFKKSNPKAYDPNKLYNSMNLAELYAKIGIKDKAIAIVEDAYNYFYKTNGEQDYFTNALMLSYSKLYYKLGLYDESIKWSNKSISIYNKNNAVKTIDKIYFEEDKADIYILNAQAKYAQSKTKDTLFLKTLIPIINDAIKAVEERKTAISSFGDLNTLIESNSIVFDFAKKIYLELYEKTKTSVYLQKLISLHESALYNRIRARLNSKPDITFSNIPKHVAEKEKTLRNLLNGKDITLDSLVPVTYKWQSFLDTLRTNYPKYHKMRYGTIEEPLDNIHDNLPNNTTIIRYIFIKNNLYGLVFSSEKQHFIKLDSNNISSDISMLSENQFNMEKTSLKLFELYQKLWKPLENYVNTKKVIIIPDGNLFNLSFESLTPKRIKQYGDLESQSLLAKHFISYNYSLLLLKKDKKVVDYENDFIAFAPEFNKKMKDNYSITITDSLSIDKTYLSLLPQPFSVDLAKEYSKVFDGDFFINENASKQIFKNVANEHKIIHIGTHAESNNVSPELSRLIFAKNDTSEDNSLYTFEIYNQSLNSNLAILTACETGKPTYQSGEGMISLAHAFNYAGSESILTSLWKIDEKSSSEIIKNFYQNIKSGVPKDEALQQAKLNYISKADGRTLHPQYWAGLILIGDTTPIDIQSYKNTIIWTILITLVLILITYLLLKNRKLKK